jgi:predicted AAA+ superfamily ATPase
MSTIARVMRESLKDALGTRRVVLLYGARQCGKSTLAKQIKGDDIVYKTLDDYALFHSAAMDPVGFVKTTKGTMIIDEIQRVPHLLMSIKKAVDDDNRYGQFLLTGSANINALPSVRESLAGRVCCVRLRTLTQSEILNIQTAEGFLEKAFNQNFSSESFKEKKSDILQYCFRGGYPETLSMSSRLRNRWYDDYVRSLVERDLRELYNIQRLDVLKKLISILCRYVG